MGFFNQGYLPARYVLSFLLIWAKCLEYAQRVCLSVTIVAMMNHTALDAGASDDTCDVPRGVNVTTPEEELPVPWKNVITSMPVWTVAIVSFCSTWGFITLLTKLPTYLEVVLHVSIQKNGLVNSLVYASICITLFVSSYLSDYLRTYKHWNSTKVRKSFEFIALAGPAVCTGLIPVARCDRISVIALLTTAMAFLGFCGGGHVSIVADMAPHHSASIFGLVNSVGCLAGIFSPMAAGFFLDNAHASVEQWSIVYYTSSGFYLLGAIIFMIWGSAERQLWAQSSHAGRLLTMPYLQSEKLPSFVNSDSDKKYGSIP